MVSYASSVLTSLETVESLQDGCSITIKWFKAYPDNQSNKVAYHIYYATKKENVYTEGVKYVSVSANLEVTLSVFDPGQMYWFAVRSIEYDPNVFDLETELPVYEGLRFYPESVLRLDITSTSLIIPLVNIDDFPNTGIIQIGAELIQYLAKDTVNEDLVLASVGQRGFNNTFPRLHTVDGYDGYRYWNPVVKLTSPGESTEYDHIYMIESSVDYDNFPYTEEDGYKQITQDLLHSDLSYSDEENENFDPYDYAGWHRIDPVKLYSGECVGSYSGGEKGCIDEYGNYNIIRGRSVQDLSNERLEMLLSISGQPAVLIKRMQTGIVCSCVGNRREYPDDRCPYCYGTKFVMGYQQHFNPKRSDGRIMIRVEPTSETLPMQEAGLESMFNFTGWTLVTPIIQQRDIIILYDSLGNELFRYEISEVTRNNLMGVDLGAQKFKAIRVRKTDTIYQVKVFSDTSKFPEKLNTSISSSANGNIPPHTHSIVVPTGVTSLSQITGQQTSVVQGHNHSISSGGLIDEVLGHQHNIILP